MKDNLSQKNYMENHIFGKCYGQIVFLKKTALQHDLSCIIRKDYIFIFPISLIGFEKFKLH